MAEQDYSPSATATKTPPAYGGGGPATTGLDEELKKLKEQLLKDQKEADKLKKKLEDEQARIKTIEKSVAESGQVTSAAATAEQNVSADRMEIKDFLATDFEQMKNSEEVKNHQGEIDARRNEVESALDDKRKNVNRLESTLKEDKNAAQTAADDQTKKKQALDELKDHPKKIQDTFGKLRKLRQRIDTEGSNKPLVRYVLAYELDEQWKPAIALFKSKEELDSLYQTRTSELRTASDNAAAAEAKYKKTQSELDAARKDLETREGSRLDDIVKRVGEIGTGEPVAVGAGARAGRAGKAS
jgi:DNA repair exonuclease SbcCD ATPase subunit